MNKLKLTKTQIIILGETYLRLIELMPLFITITIFYFVLFGGIEPFWQGILTMIGIFTGVIAAKWLGLILTGRHPFD